MVSISELEPSQEDVIYKSLEEYSISYVQQLASTKFFLVACMI